jgi:ABC-2 type transport system ATP-binding protein
MFEIHDVTATYRQSGFCLGPINLRFDSGLVSLLGSNGAGKSTLMRILAGLQKPSAGRISLDKGVTVGYLPQQFQLPGRARCGQFLEHIAWLWGVPRQQRPGLVERTLKRVGLQDHADSRIKTLSGGMRQRLGIAQAIVHQPAGLVLDEPTVGLDPAQRLAIRQTIAEISQEHPTLLSTHLLEDVRALAGRVVVLRDGKIVHDGLVTELTNANEPTEQFEARVARWMVGDDNA